MRRVAQFSLLAFGVLLTGCPPALYVAVANQTHGVVKIDTFDQKGSGTFLPHFQLAPGQSRRVLAGSRLVAHDSDGRLIGILEPSRISTSSEYFDPGSYTFFVAVREKGVFLVHPDE